MHGDFFYYFWCFSIHCLTVNDFLLLDQNMKIQFIYYNNNVPKATTTVLKNSFHDTCLISSGPTSSLVVGCVRDIRLHPIGSCFGQRRREEGIKKTGSVLDETSSRLVVCVTWIQSLHICLYVVQCFGTLFTWSPYSILIGKETTIKKIFLENLWYKFITR